ncbi:S9 family peptidase [Galbibacter sp. BG1]|uniref:prolyl oligopeptidase family serine peptidase n=1 Tax=Galbibacter sp. BG1 TaxID=1170699 RepID=UPI0015B8F2EF|nr:prolyl oligopeptidase family serine peptidase [Galbibacter sp. BG1]QLE02673.1 S9 family peptidase [Galbibacter sp. BG1]
MKRTLLYTFLFLSIFTALAQKNNTSSLSIKQIMQGDDFVGHLPSNPYWSLDGKNIYFDWNPENAFSDSLYVYSLETGKTNKLSFEEQYKLPAENGSFNSDKSKKIYAKHGDIFIAEVNTGKKVQITATKDRESNPHFTNNEKEIAFIKGKNIYTWNMDTGTIEQITDFQEKEKKEEKRSEKDEWLYKDQLALFDVLKERKEKEDLSDVFSEKEKLLHPLPIYTGDKTIYNQQINPTGQYATFLIIDRTEDKETIVPHYVTESGYTEDQKTRSKVGNKPDVYELHIYDTENRKTYAVNLKNLEGLDYIPEYTKDYPNKTYKNENRIGFIDGPVWNEAGTKAVLDIISNDYKDRWIVSLNAADGTVTNLDHQHDNAWIAGPGIGGYRGGELGWMPDDKSIWFQSEKTGYSHLYTLNTETKKSKELTSGDFEIYNPKLSKDKKSWYFTANKTHPGDRQFYTMPLNGGKMKQLTERIGKNDVVLSPDEKNLAILYSYSNKPTELFVMPNPVYRKNATEPTQITHSTTKEFENYSWKEPKIITFKADDGANVHARLYQPKSEIKNGAAVIFVHGAGYLQNAHKWWSSYFREYMFHNILVDNGYTVLDIDYRASAGYGRDWRTGIYRHMGGKDLSDQVDGAEYLISQLGVDKDKIGIYGGSYGGFITLMAMFNEADTFSAGAAIRSVGDWAAYNHGYTARILNTPVTDSLAYRRSSPIYFADGLEGDLLILHGMVDDNVHFQDMVRLSQRLIELGKTNWEMAVYPIERHGFTEPSSWTDEYTRIFKLFNESLLDK